MNISKTPKGLVVAWQPTDIDFIVGNDGQTERRFGYYNKSVLVKVPRIARRLIGGRLWH